VTLDARFLALGGLLVLGFGTQVLTGFGGIIITLTLGAHLYALDALLPVLVPLSLLSTSYIVLRHGARIDRGLLFGRILPLMGAGFAVGALGFARFGGDPWIRRGYGVLVTGIALREVIARARGRRLPEPPEGRADDPALAEAASAAADQRAPAGLAADAAGAGVVAPPTARRSRAPWLVLSGIAQGLYASGGPLLVHALAREAIDKGRFRSTLCAVWLLLNATLVGSYALGGRLDAASLTRSAALLPAVGLAILLGEWGHHRIDERGFRAAIDVLLLVAGAALLAR
jgi:hypothetical protein